MIPLFDAYSGFGGSKRRQRRPPTAGELVGEMARLSIGRALVRTAPEELDTDPAASNDSLLATCGEHPQLLACPVVIPNTAGDVMPGTEQVAGLLGRGAAAVCIRPKLDQWLLDEWACGPLFEALRDARVPVLCKQDQVPIKDLADLAGRYPELPLVLAATGYRQQRVVLPLMKTFGNVHFCLGGSYSLHRGLAQLAATLGPERILFGTGFPEAEAMAAVTLVMYADIGDDQRSLIGAGNLERLLGGIVR